MSDLHFVNLSRNDLLALSLCSPKYPLRKEICEQIKEYYHLAMRCDLKIDEDPIDWFLDNHIYSEKTGRWKYVLLRGKRFAT
jgi:hypothetical protein